MPPLFTLAVETIGLVEPALSQVFRENSWQCCQDGRGLVVDVGGNYGWFTLLGASMGCDVVTFEPVPANVALIRTNLRNNPQLARQTVTIHPHVVHPTPGVYTLSVPIPRVNSPRGWRKPLGMIGMHGEVGMVKGMGVGWLHYNVTAGAVGLDQLVLPRLRSMGGGARVCMLKVDVEGYEPEALQTARRLFRYGLVHAVQLELNFGDTRAHASAEQNAIHAQRTVEMLQMLEERGFELRQLAHHPRAPAATRPAVDNHTAGRQGMRSTGPLWPTLPPFPSKRSEAYLAALPSWAPHVAAMGHVFERSASPGAARFAAAIAVDRPSSHAISTNIVAVARRPQRLQSAVRP